MASHSAAAIPLSHLWQVTGKAMAAMLQDGSGFEANRSPEHWSVIGGEPGALFNWLVIHSAHADNDARLRAGIAAFRARRASALVLIPEALATGLEPVALELGLESPHLLPLMLLRPNQPTTRSSPPGLVVERVRDERGLRVSTDIAAAAYDESAASFARCCGPSLLAAPAMSLYLAQAGSDALSMCWIWREGPLAYVGSMAT